MANPYVKSIFWLVGCSGLGYVLLSTCTQSEHQIETLRKTLPGVERKSESLKKREQLIKALESATTDKPIYLMTKEDLQSDN